jgi:hypothetical protein
MEGFLGKKYEILNSFFYFLESLQGSVTFSSKDGEKYLVTLSSKLVWKFEVCVHKNQLCCYNKNCDRQVTDFVISRPGPKNDDLTYTYPSCFFNAAGYINLVRAIHCLL